MEEKFTEILRLEIGSEGSARTQYSSELESLIGANAVATIMQLTDMIFSLIAENYKKEGEE